MTNSQRTSTDRFTGEIAELEFENRRLKERVEELCELYAKAKDDCRKLEDKIAVLEGRVEPDYPGLAEFELANEQGYSEHDQEAFDEMNRQDLELANQFGRLF